MRVVVLMVMLAGCGRVGFDSGARALDGDASGDDAAAGRPVMWVMDGTTIVTIDRATMQKIGTMPTPAGILSPHALAFDGTSLWVGGYGNDKSLHEIDPLTGADRSTIANFETEGIAIAGPDFWIASAVGGQLRQITRQGVEVALIPTAFAVIQDVAFDGDDVYFVVNGATDPIVRVDLPARTQSTLIDPAVASGIVYALGFDGTYICTMDGAKLRRIRTDTGAIVDETPLPVSGTQRAIAFGILQ